MLKMFDMKKRPFWGSHKVLNSSIYLRILLFGTLYTFFKKSLSVVGLALKKVDDLLILPQHEDYTVALSSETQKTLLELKNMKHAAAESIGVLLAVYWAREWSDN